MPAKRGQGTLIARHFEVMVFVTFAVVSTCCSIVRDTTRQLTRTEVGDEPSSEVQIN